MALKGPRVILETDIKYASLSAQTRGVCMAVTTQGSGVALGDSAGVADAVANPSGYAAAGLLLGDVVSIDPTRQHLNFHKDETLVGYRVTLLRKGQVTTDKIIGTPADGDPAYMSSSGNLTPTLHASGGLVATPKVGRFRSAKDEGGFATIDFNLPA